MEQVKAKEPQIKIGLDLRNIFPFRAVDANNQVMLTQGDQPQEISDLQSKIVTLELKCNKSCDEAAQCKSIKEQYTAFLNYKALCADLADNLTAGNFCKVEPRHIQPKPNTVNGTLTPWVHKIKYSDSGSAEIFGDFYTAAEKLSSNMRGSLGYIGRSMTLMLPASHMPYLLAKTGVHSSALEMIHAAFPDLKFMSVPELKTEDKSFAVIVCSGNEYGPAGYFVAKEPTITKTDATKDKYDEYHLTMSEHKLLIDHPEQIVVLEGI
ncbi:MAG: hypothetical protein ROM54_04115 [Anaerobiospirillum sp.]|nr:hypothetical protein [Anaerobiospirillum sp.]